MLGEKLKAVWTRISDRISEQAWAQEIKSKWEELDAQSRLYLKTASGIIAFALVLSLSLWGIFTVRGLKKDYFRRTELLAQIQNAQNEMRSANPSGGDSDESIAWSAYIEGLAAGQGIDRSSLTIGAETKGDVSDRSEEALIDLAVKKINIKKLIRLAYHLENGSHPIKVRHLSIDTQLNAEGYLDATLAISAFKIKP